MKFEDLIERIKEIKSLSIAAEQKLQAICNMLEEEVPHYDWVGFYIARGKELLLGPFSGEPTEHTRIKFGQGVCGQAAAQEKTIIVGDVSKETNYLSCSPKVKSEIVVPIFQNGRIVAELDIDSHTINAFGSEDREFLEQVCSIVADLFGEHK